MARRRSAKAVAVGLPRPWSLFKQAVADYRSHWRAVVGIMLVVGVPVAVLSNLLSSTGDGTVSAYLAFAQLCLNVALVYAVGEWLHGRSTSIRQAYYNGSAMLVRSMLVSAMLIVMALLLVIGLLILAFGVFAPRGDLNGFEQFLLIMLAVAVAVPSIILVVRALWALYVIFETPQGPIEAVKVSRKLTKGRVLASLGRLAALAVLIGATVFVPLLVIMLMRTKRLGGRQIALLVGSLVVAVVVSPVIILLVVQGLLHATIITILLQILVTLMVLPTANFYLYRYYQGLA